MEGPPADDIDLDKFYFPGVDTDNHVLQLRGQGEGEEGEADEGVRGELLYKRTQDIPDWKELNFVSTFQSHQQVLDRKEKLRTLKQISRMEQELLAKNKESEEIQEEVQELKV